MDDTWDYDLTLPPSQLNHLVTVYDVDLFDTNVTEITRMHEFGHRVICYMSAGSFEDWRPDMNNFSESDLGKNLDGWEGERWLNVSSENVREAMKWRLDLAKEKKCDGVDPDNIDGYDNDTGLNLTEDNAVDYITFLSNYSRGHNLSIGLKNGGSIADRVVNLTHWVVVEQCIQYDECGLYDSFLAALKPVFNVEYPKKSSSNSADVSNATYDKYCEYEDLKGFMTILKNLNLDNWTEFCPYRLRA